MLPGFENLPHGMLEKRRAGTRKKPTLRSLGDDSSQAVQQGCLYWGIWTEPSCVTTSTT